MTAGAPRPTTPARAAGLVPHRVPRTASTSPRATATTPSRPSSRSASATASSSPARSRPWPGDRHAGPRRRRASRRASQQADGAYSVLGKNAHAWPEVWFDGLGWVPFEPTPGRGAPGAEDYTGVPPEQDETTPQAGAGDDGEEPAPRRTAPPSPDEAERHRPTRAPGRRGRRADGPSRDPPRRRAVAASSARHAGRPSSSLLPRLVRRWRRRHPSRRHRPPDRRPVEPGDRRRRRHGVPGRPVADADRAGPGRRPATARGRPTAQVAGRGRPRRPRSPRPTRWPSWSDADRRRARTTPVVPAGRADRQRLDDAGRPRCGATSRSGPDAAAPGGADAGLSRRSRGCRRGGRRRARR